MAYCIAFSTDGATDVTRRYVRNSRHGLDRTKAPEEVLLWITDEIRRMRRESLSKEEKRRLVIEDEREEQELRGYVAQAIALEVTHLLPGGAGAGGSSSSLAAGGGAAVAGVGVDAAGTTVVTAADAEKLPAGRQSGSPEWIQARGEGGSQQQQQQQHSSQAAPPHPPHPREGH
jgi:peptide-N4-(N-acetyl-beta-glucosaminyl)asparagine amidase